MIRVPCILPLVLSVKIDLLIDTTFFIIVILWWQPINQIVFLHCSMYRIHAILSILLCFPNMGQSPRLLVTIPEARPLTFELFKENGNAKNV